MELILVRHGEPVRITSEESGGAPVDPVLTDRGHAQAERLAQWLVHEHVDHIVSSPLARAHQTAAPVAMVHATSATFAVAPIDKVLLDRSTVSRPATRPSQMTRAGSISAFVNHKPASVEPATMNASG